MSKNYKIGSKFRVTSNSTNGFNVGEIVNLVAKRVDGLFEMDNGAFQQTLYEDQFELACEPAPSKLKPAKQALADAIHQNGGWVEGAEWCAISSADMKGSFWNAKEHGLSRENGIWCGYGYMHGRCFSVDRLPVNHHQTILSRDEYFTAYPEQVKVEVKNETEHKVEVEMKSESEVTIKVSDWHKNGELPPVGEVCEAYIDYPPQWVETEIVAHKDGFAIGWCKSVMKGCHGDKAHEFRPLRTERDKAIDEMMEHCDYLGSRDFAGKLFDAGYRKEVKL